MIKQVTILTISIFFFSACEKEENTGLVPEYANIWVPDYITRPKTIENIPKSGVKLGEKLFFDVNLSSNKLVSCATCHAQEMAFGEDLALSTYGVSGEKLPRNTPPLFNLAWHTGLFWDGGAPDLSSQALGPLFSENEMDADLNEILAYLKSETRYQDLFKKSFEDGEINTKNFLKALSFYQLSLVSFTTKYDKFYHSKDSSVFSTEEIKGLKIYEKQCNSCHRLPLGSSYNYANNELDKEFNFHLEDERLGRNRITNLEEDLGKYKIPSLRNLSFSSPYMHDGRFASIDEVLNHYQEINTFNVQTSLNKKNKESLKQFLYTLNDTIFTKK